ncbi:MAG: hypothetical protein AAF913_07030 [Pseudomonadota bacterium]
MTELSVPLSAKVLPDRVDQGRAGGDSGGGRPPEAAREAVL